MLRILGNMKIHRIYDFIGGLLFLIVAIVGIQKEEPGIYITFIVLAAVFLGQGLTKKKK